MKLLIRCAIALTSLGPTLSSAQDALPPPPGAGEPQGFVAEPGLVTRAAIFADRHLGKGGLTNGIFVDYGNMIPGAGWMSAGPGYRHWYKQDNLFVEGSASISVNGYKMAQGRVELPAMLKSRLALGTQLRWQDFGRLDYFGSGRSSVVDSLSNYSIESSQVTAYATLRPVRWMALGGEIGWMNPQSRYVDGNLLQGLDDQRTFVPSEVSLTIDTRDFPEHPTSGIVLRGVGANYDDRTSGDNTFKRYQGEAAGFLRPTPKSASRCSPTWISPPSWTPAASRAAPATSISSSVVTAAASASTRAAPPSRSWTWQRAEGWRYVFRLKDPLALSRLTKKNTLVPFAP